MKTIIDSSSPKFITFEGGEGSGKTTQSRLLYDKLIKMGIEVVHTREPGGTSGAELIRSILVTGDVARWEAKTELLLHLAARYEHVIKVIKPALAAKKWVICDRFTDSTVAYQGFGHGLSREFVLDITTKLLGDFKPDLTFILDVDVEKGMARAGLREGMENRYEKMDQEFHRKVHEGFLKIAEIEQERCKIINAEADINEVNENILSFFVTSE